MLCRAVLCHHQIIGKSDSIKVVRMQFARMKPGTLIKIHRDMGGYALVGAQRRCEAYTEQL